jgi:hypothetical protein
MRASLCTCRCLYLALGCTAADTLRLAILYNSQTRACAYARRVVQSAAVPQHVLCAGLLLCGAPPQHGANDGQELREQLPHVLHHERVLLHASVLLRQEAWRAEEEVRAGRQPLL